MKHNLVRRVIITKFIQYFYVGMTSSLFKKIIFGLISIRGEEA